MSRIWVVGPCGAGKTTAARAIAERIGVAPTHIDEMHHLPGWKEVPREVLAARVAEVVLRPRWVIDGNYTEIRRRHLDAADLFVWLDLPLRVTFPRLLERGIVRSWTKERICNGNVETLRRMFLHKDSLLLWALTSHRRRKRKLLEDLTDRPHVRLRSQRAVDKWLLSELGVERVP